MNFLQIFRKRFTGDVIIIQVNYKSGNSQRFFVDKFDVRWGSNKEMSWNSISSLRPLLLNIDEVESVWQIGGWPKFKFFGLRK